jgi:endonuclease/exonuclease/phosphatase family metal-dependent hydrolase
MLKLMTFNIRYGIADDKENHWDNRKALVIDRIKAFDPDLIGMQECRDDLQAKFIKLNLADYGFYGVRREGGGDTALEMAPILFKESAFQLIQKGHFWLSDTPQIAGSNSWGSTFPRTATWVELLHQASGRSFIFLNTHFDYEPSAIDESAKLLKAWSNQITEKHPLIVTGDFNADKNSSAYQLLADDKSLFDVYKKAHPSNKNDGTYHGYGHEETAIDWILATDHFEVNNAEIDRFHAGNLYPSDHYLVTAIIQWKK